MEKERLLDELDNNRFIDLDTYPESTVSVIRQALNDLSDNKFQKLIDTYKPYDPRIELIKALLCTGFLSSHYSYLASDYKGFLYVFHIINFSMYILTAFLIISGKGGIGITCLALYNVIAAFRSTKLVKLRNLIMLIRLIDEV